MGYEWIVIIVVVLIIYFIVRAFRNLRRAAQMAGPATTLPTSATIIKEREVFLESVAFERFSVYKFGIDYPSVCKIEFNPKSRREGGDVVFHFPDREKMFLSWGDLEKAQKKFGTAEEQAEHSLKVVTKGGSVKKMEKLWCDTLSISSHEAAYNRVKLDEVPRGIFPSKRTISHETHSIHLHCDKSSRYFVIYSMLSPNAPEDFGNLLMTMAKSFKCH